MHVKHLKEGDRILAESYYKYALALEYAQDFSGAVENLQSALSVLAARQKQLRDSLDAIGAAGDAKGKGVMEDSQAAKLDAIKNEISDIESLFPDIEAKIEELKANETKASAERESLVKAAESFIFKAPEESASAAVPVNDLSNLVRKKAKRPVEETKEADESKKARQDEETQ